MQDVVSLQVPAQPSYARSVRMLAASLAVSCAMSVDDVEDVRMAAEEGFVYACATKPERCDIRFEMGERQVSIDLSLGETELASNQEELSDAAGEATGDLDLVALLLEAVSDEFSIQETDEGAYLHLVKRAAHDE